MNLAEQYKQLALQEIANQEAYHKVFLASEKELADSILEKEIQDVMIDIKDSAESGGFHCYYISHFLNREKIKEFLELKGFEVKLTYEPEPYSKDCEFSIDIHWGSSCDGLAGEYSIIAQKKYEEIKEEKRIHSIKKEQQELQEIPKVLENALHQIKTKASKGEFLSYIDRIKKSQQHIIYQKLKDHGFEVILSSDELDFYPEYVAFMVYWE